MICPKQTNNLEYCQLFWLINWFRPQSLYQNEYLSGFYELNAKITLSRPEKDKKITIV